MKAYTNRTTCTHDRPTLKPRGGVKAKFDFEIWITIASAVYLLNCIVSCFVMCCFITNGTVSNKYINILGIV
jgi:hypothetical protein